MNNNNNKMNTDESVVLNQVIWPLVGVKILGTTLELIEKEGMNSFTNKIIKWIQQ